MQVLMIYGLRDKIWTNSTNKDAQS